MRYYSRIWKSTSILSAFVIYSCTRGYESLNHLNPTTYDLAPITKSMSSIKVFSAVGMTGFQPNEKPRFATVRELLPVFLSLL